MTNQKPMPNPKTSRLTLLAGLVSTAAALAAGELAAGAVPSWRSTVEAVGSTIIDNVPGAVERWAISTLGTADKPVLVVSTVIVVLALGTLLGRVAARNFPAAAVGVAALGAVGLGASAAQGSALTGMPAVVTAIVGIPLLKVLVDRAVSAAAGTDDAADEPAASAPETGAGSSQPTPVMRAGAGDRRAFLTLAGGVAGASAVAVVGGRALNRRQRQAVSAARDEIAQQIGQTAVPSPGDGVGSATERALGVVDAPLPPIPEGADFGIAGLAPFVTPMDEFYRIDTALTIPQVNPSTWSMRIHGMVDEELEFTYDDLLRRPDLIETDITLTCVSNEVGGDLIGNARWTGVPLKNLLEEAGVAAASDQVVGRSVDGFTAGFPVEVAMDGRDAIVAVLMNGEPLPPERGFPARIVVPGIYGYVSATKWLSDIELTTFADFEAYWIEREWDVEAPIKVQSRIDVPRPLERVPTGDIVVAGVAWAQPVGIDKVEIRVDGGEWMPTELAEDVSPNTWRQWRWTWTGAAPGNHTLEVRATDKNGMVQVEERQPPFPDGATGWMKLLVTVTE